MPSASQPDPADRPDSTVSYSPTRVPAPADSPSDRAGSSLVTLSPVAPPPVRPANPDDAPTVITSGSRESATRPEAIPGSRLGHFELIEAVGAGGMAAVLRAKDQELGREVALKILPAHMAADPENVIRFKLEARAAAKLDHDNIARVFFCGEDRGQHFIAFEFVEGVNLRELIDRRGVLPASECLRYMAQVAAGLAHAAERGVVHRDVKPSNIIITPDGKAKLVDMGLARSLHGQSVNGGLTQSGVTLGTFDYISPEQALDPRRADVRSDIYSLGCAFYHALTGRPPVPEGTAAKKLYAHQHEPAIDPRVLNPAVPDDVAAVLARMMAKNPDRRYQTPAEVITDLRAVAAKLSVQLDGMTGSLSGDFLPVFGGIGAAPEPPRIPLGWVAGLAALVVAVAVLADSTSGPIGPNQPALPHESIVRPTESIPSPSPMSGVVSPPLPVVAARRESPQTADELGRALEDSSVAEIRLSRGVRYDLNTLGRGIVVERSVQMIGAAGPDAPVIRVAVGSADSARVHRPGTLTLRAAEAIRVEGVRFELVDSTGADDQPTDPVGLMSFGVRNLAFHGCQFAAPDLGAAAAAGLGVAAAPFPDPPTELTFSYGFFDVRRSVGARLGGRVRARFTETIFAPHQSAIELEAAADGRSPSSPDELRLTHCSFLLDQKGAAIRADFGGRWATSAGYCVFAGPPIDPDGMSAMMTDPSERKPAVLRVESDRPGPNATFSGRPGEPNAYYRVDPVVAGSGGATRGYSFSECRAFGDPPPASDPGALELTLPPWESADPVADLAEANPWRAFRLRTTYRKLQLPPPIRLLGARFQPAGNGTTPPEGLTIYDVWPPKLGAEATGSTREKVWNPSAEEPTGRNEFTHLAEAVDSLRPGDVLWIRHDGPLAVPPVSFARSRGPITIRKHPESIGLVLTAPANARPDDGIFLVNDGELSIEKLEFSGGAAVVISGGGRCALRDCVVTLTDEGTDRAAVVVAGDPDSQGNGRRPAATIENTLIRGRGAAVRVRSARPFDLDLKNVIAALAGPLIAIDPPNRAYPADSSSQLLLSQVTAMLSGPVLDLRPGRPAFGWVPVEVTASRCAFAPLVTRRPAPLVFVTPADEPPDPSRYLKWASVGRPNWYAFPPDAVLLELVPSGGMSDPYTERAVGWFRFTKEKLAALGSVGFAAPPQAAGDLFAVTPDVFLVTRPPTGAEAGDAGADVRSVARPLGEPDFSFDDP